MPSGPLSSVEPAAPHADGEGAPRRRGRGEPGRDPRPVPPDPREPRVAFEERQAAAWVAEELAQHGYEVEEPAGTLATAIRATRRGGRGGDGPRIGILAEYDALPGLGHGCGHNTMAASGVGAAIALAAIADELAGEIVFLGCPAEERGSGKAR